MKSHSKFTRALTIAGLSLSIAAWAPAQNSNPDKQRSTDTGQTDATRTGVQRGSDHADHAGPQPAQKDNTRSRTSGTAAATDENAAMVGQGDAAFMKHAAEAGLMEVRLAQLAQQKATSDDVKQYAKQLEAEHSKANDQLKQIAAQKKVDLPTTMGDKHQKMVSKLEGASADSFDREYMKMMVKDHKKDIKEFQKHADRSMDSDVKEFAQSTLPNLQKHLQQAEQISGNLRSTGTRARTADNPDATKDRSTSKDSSTPSLDRGRTQSDTDPTGAGRDTQRQPKNDNNPTPQP